MNRGSVGIDILIVLAAVAVLSGWNPLAAFKPKPPAKEVQALQTEVAALQIRLEETRSTQVETATAERVKADEQVRWAQQMVTGSEASLERLPVISRTVETNLASDFLRRANFALGQAIGELPQDKRAEILLIVDKALSGVEAERNIAQAMLVKKDQDLDQLAAQRAALQKQLDDLAVELVTRQKQYLEVKTQLDTKTTDLVTWAEQKDQADRRAASLSGLLDNIQTIIIILVIGYIFVAFILPGIVKHLQPGKIKNFLRDVSGYATSPLLYRDAKNKLSTKSA